MRRVSGQAADGDVGVGLELTGADGHVDVVVDDVEIPVWPAITHIHLGVTAGVFAQRRNVVHGERQRRRDPQVPVGFECGGVDRVFGILQVGRMLRACAKNSCPDSVRLLPRVALDQPHAQTFFQRGPDTGWLAAALDRSSTWPAAQAAGFSHLHKEF